MTLIFFLVNAIYLEKCIDKLSEEELMDVKVKILTSCLLELTLFSYKFSRVYYKNALNFLEI